MPRDKLDFLMPKPCEYCGKLFIPKRPWGKYCSPDHRQMAFYIRASKGETIGMWWEQKYDKPQQPSTEKLDEATEALDRAKGVDVTHRSSLEDWLNSEMKEKK